MKLFLYGPPGSGKTTIGRMLAQELDLDVADLDVIIEDEAGKTIPEIFAEEGEQQFRDQETRFIERVIKGRAGVVALGGGALLRTGNRALAEAHGVVVCLASQLEVILKRLEQDENKRPLLAGDAASRLAALLEERSSHYASFAHQVDTSMHSQEDIIRQIQVILGSFRVRGMGQSYDVRISPKGLMTAGEAFLELGLKGPVALVSDENVHPLYGDRTAETLVKAGYDVQRIVITAGEQHKTMAAVSQLWEGFLEARLERGSTVVALGGGVVGDLSGFAAATYLRGVSWVNLPTTVLAMVDSSIGGKTGADLPQGKNLVGAFHAPRLVLADPQTLDTLPEDEVKNGLAEVVKHGVIGDTQLFSLCAKGLPHVKDHWDEVIRRGMAVKINIVRADPFEGGVRQVLNLGHTIGHGVETASDYQIKHGEAVSIGMVLEARLAENIGLAEGGLAEKLAAVLGGLGLPTSVVPDIDAGRMFDSMKLDKKRAGGKVRFSLPVDIGRVEPGVEVDGFEDHILKML